MEYCAGLSAAEADAYLGCLAGERKSANKRIPINVAPSIAAAAAAAARMLAACKLKSDLHLWPHLTGCLPACPPSWLTRAACRLESEKCRSGPAGASGRTWRAKQARASSFQARLAGCLAGFLACLRAEIPLCRLASARRRRRERKGPAVALYKYRSSFARPLARSPAGLFLGDLRMLARAKAGGQVLGKSPFVVCKWQERPPPLLATLSSL